MNTPSWRPPAMVRALAWVLVLDLVGITLNRAGAGGFFVLLALASNLVAVGGGLEAVNWILHRSPWVLLIQALNREARPAAPDPDRVESTAADYWVSLYRNLPLEDRPELRRGLMRLLSGAALAFLGLSLVRLGLPAKAAGWGGNLLALLDLERAHLAPMALGSALYAPLLAVLLGREDPPRGWEWLHVALATTLAAGAALLLHRDLGSPALGRYLETLLQVALDPGGVFYGLMAGGVFWWLVGLAGRPQGPSGLELPAAE